MARNTDHRPFFARVGNWGISRLRKPDLIERSARNIRGATTSALEAVRPVEFDRGDIVAGYRGRHVDGGRAHFREMVKSRGLSDGQLTQLHVRHLVLAFVFVLAAVASQIYGLYMMFTADDMLAVFGGGAVAAVFFAFMALAMRHDFAAWQIRMRRFGGFSEYLATRL